MTTRQRMVREAETEVHAKETDFRESDSWDLEDVHQDFDATWVQQSSQLPYIPPREGMEQRWVRSRLGGEPDAQRLTSARGQGWKRRLPETVPTHFRALTVRMEGAGEVIGAGGHILMERPMRLGDILRQRVRAMTDNQMRSVDESMFNVHNKGDGFGPPRRVEDRTTVSVGRPVTMQDD